MFMQQTQEMEWEGLIALLKAQSTPYRAEIQELTKSFVLRLSLSYTRKATNPEY